MANIRWFFMAVLLVYTAMSYAETFTFKQLISPGDLSAAHSEFNSGCEQCHRGLDKSRQTGLCLDCHKEIKLDIAADEGFHGKGPGVANSECRLCHTEHKGKGANIRKSSGGIFNHDFTDFQLTGAHSSAQCSGCHKTENHYRDTPSACFDCHEPDDVHQQSLGKECQQCHETHRWVDNRFDHQDTDFHLLGAHQDVSCGHCHSDQRFSSKGKTCIDCHQSDDVHAGEFGKQCDSCHNNDAWRSSQFNHVKETGFELIGNHAELDCQQCHLPNHTGSMQTQCSDCHRSDDVHLGSRGQQCQQCHNNEKWDQLQFDHDTFDFPLHGKHEDVECAQCHEQDVYRPLQHNSCSDCHRDDNPHGKHLGTCESCHNEKAWRDTSAFMHDFTRFPLLGMHGLLSCGSCHSDMNYKPVEDRSCVACHQQDDKHNGAFGDSCDSCHGNVGWRQWQFDHNSQTEFKLTGQHSDLSCDSCHSYEAGNYKNANPHKQDTSCISCHGIDDVHGGEFGYDCALCHVTSSFSDVEGLIR